MATTDPKVTPLEQLHECARRGNLGGLVELITTKGSALVNQRGTLGYTSLHWAANAGHYEIVRQLVFEKADVDAAADNGDTALHLAAQKDHVKVARFLIDSGANTQLENAEGVKPIDIARSDAMKDVITNIDAPNLVQVEAEDEDSE